MIELVETQFTIPRELHNQRIDRIVTQLLPQYSRSLISNWIKSGAITINQKTCKPKEKGLEGDLINLNVSLNTIETDFNLCEPEHIPLNIVFEDDEVLVINKNAGLVVHPGAGNKEHTLVNALLYHAPELRHIPRAGIVHRLDKDTTGLLIIAKSLTAHTSLIRQMQAREIQRHYITLVIGHLISGGTIDTGFGRHPRNRLKMAVTANGRQAITHYIINKQYNDFTLLDVRLMTGRTHQIRVHLAHINHPVVGDPLYNARRVPAQISEELREQLLEFKRQALHACSIQFLHPKMKTELTFHAPLPDDFTQLLSYLEQYYGY
jgi:23S rRNA pseudouridine1911/1915/1917 synthase